MRRQAFDILVLGPLLRDHLFVTKGEPLAYGGTIGVKEVPVTLSGSGANVALALARLGSKVSLVTAVGRDARGDDALRELSNENVDTSLAARASLVETGLSVTVLADRGEREPLVLRAAGATDLIEITEEVLKTLHTTQWLYLSGFQGAWAQQVGSLLDTLARESVRLAWHPGPGVALGERDLVTALLQRTEVLFVNEEEGQKLAESQSTHESIEAGLRRRGASVVSLTRGSGGAHVQDARTHVSAAAPSTPVVDPRGAGDAFRAAFLVGFVSSGGDVAVALEWGLTNAASVVSSYTTQRGLLSRAVLEERLRVQRVSIERSVPA